MDENIGVLKDYIICKVRQSFISQGEVGIYLKHGILPANFRAKSGLQGLHLPNFKTKGRSQSQQRQGMYRARHQPSWVARSSTPCPHSAQPLQSQSAPLPQCPGARCMEGRCSQMPQIQHRHQQLKGSRVRPLMCWEQSFTRMWADSETKPRPGQ